MLKSLESGELGYKVENIMHNYSDKDIEVGSDDYKELR